MRVDLRVNLKKLFFFGSFGWFKNEEFSLIKIDLINYTKGINTVYLLDFQFLKFMITIGFDWE